MLEVVIKGTELFDERTMKFVPEVPDVVLLLEHSLVSLSKWEEKFEKPFLVPEERTQEEVEYYIKCMVVEGELTSEAYSRMTEANQKQINEYIGAKRTATTFYEPKNKPKGPKGETVTSELIYFWMTSYNIPFIPAETWHLNRLFTLIRVANVKNSKPTKMSRAEAAKQRSELNAQRRASLNTTG